MVCKNRHNLKIINLRFSCCYYILLPPLLKKRYFRTFCYLTLCSTASNIRKIYNLWRNVSWFFFLASITEKNIFCILVAFICVHHKMIIYRTWRILSGIQNYSSKKRSLWQSRIFKRYYKQQKSQHRPNEWRKLNLYNSMETEHEE